MRLVVSRRTDVALAVLRALGAADGPLAGRTLAASLRASPTYIASAIAPLVANGWVASRPGRNGGYEVTPAGARTSVLDVVEVVEGPLDDGHCALEGRPCGVSPCAIHEAWSHARTSLQRALAIEPSAG